MIINESSPFIVPIIEEGVYIGCGCFIGDLFMTAAHVVMNNNSFIYIQDQRIQLLTKDAEIFSFVADEDDSKVSDYAIFRIQGINSPMCVSNQPLIIGDKIECMFAIPGDGTSSGPHYEIHSVPGTVEQRIFSFYACQMYGPIRPGLSGSPIMRNNQVVGILSRGPEDVSISPLVYIQSIPKYDF